MIPDAFGTLNAAYVQSLYEAFLADPASLDEAWRQLFEDGLKGLEPDAPARSDTTRGDGSEPAPVRSTEEVTPLRGAAARIVDNMTASLSVPTATSYREVPVNVLDRQRKALNQQLRERGDTRKFSFTHLIAFAMVRAAREMPVMTHAFRDIDGTPHRVNPRAVHLGLAVDVERRDGTRSLVVPVVRDAEQLRFADFVTAVDTLVDGARRGSLLPDAYHGAVITLTNPGTIGTHASVPRLMPGQGTIVATGAIALPAAFREVGSTERSGIEKVMTVSSTYDHRVIQGAESGLFLRRVDELLGGADGFYAEVFADLSNEPMQAVERTPVVPTSEGSATPPEGRATIVAAMALVKAFRHYGHRAAHLDPLGSAPPGDPALDPARLGLTEEAMSALPAPTLRLFVPGPTLREAYEQLCETYCGSLAYEVEHIANHDERVWLRELIESGSHRAALTSHERERLLTRLVKVDALERFLHRQYMGHKRFGIEGLDMLVPMLAHAIELGAGRGLRQVVMGMAHRGRLNVLAHIVGIPYETLLAEFEGGLQVEETLAPRGGTGDVKYHHGAEGIFAAANDKTVTVTLSPNPSHLEAVDPVVEGRARAEQTARLGRDAHREPDAVLPILIHGDAAFAAQGIVAETFNLERLDAYSTGGTLHIIANNQIGFTTDPSDSRSTDAASDLAKGFDIPIVHVNADDPEACLSAINLAIVYRDTFRGDVLINLVGYRRHGHNEGDEPSYTQPEMYRRIKEHRTVVQQYTERLVATGVLAAEELEALEQKAYERLADAQATVKASSDETAERGTEPQRISQHGPSGDEPQTCVPGELLRALNEQLLSWPESFHVHPKLERQLNRRRSALADDRIDWAHAEALALASLLTEGVPIRFTGQDTERGTFSQRHLVLHDSENGETYCPIQQLSGARAAMELHNSALSEYGALGFEYGYAVAAPEALVLWEAQFGDFANGAEIIIDQFIIAGLAKWGETSRLTLLLPHGYEGQGPEHSSARLERYLALGAEGNIRVANCTTPAQYFHLLRRQAKHPEQRPLVVMTPKSLLRLPQAASAVDALTDGRFRAVVPDHDNGDAEQIRKLVLCTGKVYYDLVGADLREEARHVAIGRVELLYPFPTGEITQLMGRYPNLETVAWVQEEPSNMGARKFVVPPIDSVLPASVTIEEVCRPERSSPAEGYPAAHIAEQRRIVQHALS